MLRESEKRAAFLAVTRNHSESPYLAKTFDGIVQTCETGTFSDFLDSLVTNQLLTSHQARQLKVTTPSSELENHTPFPKKNGNKKAAPPSIPLAPTQPALHPHAKPPKKEESPLIKKISDYRILRKLAEGGMCPVYLGYHEREHRRVALKVLPEHLAEKREMLDRFLREGHSGALLNHPNIVRNLDAGKDPVTAQYFLVMEYIDGPSALDLLNRDCPLSVPDALRIILDIARALEHAHSRNIIHRDIKPDNILITRTGVAKLADMGLAKRTDDNSNLTVTRQGFGTPHYMPYEQAINAKYADRRSDIYALGATLYHFLTGELPFPGNNQLEILEKKDEGFFLPASCRNPDIPEILDEIIGLMLARDPVARYQTVSELIVDLERTNLAGSVLSFVDQEAAYQDPVVRERLAVAPQPTRADIQRGGEENPPRPKTNPNIWYYRYRMKDNKWCKARATTRELIQGLLQRRIPHNVQISRRVDGKYRPVFSIPEVQMHLQRLRNSGTSPRRVRSARNGKSVKTVSNKSQEGKKFSNWDLLGVFILGLVVIILSFFGLVFLQIS